MGYYFYWDLQKTKGAEQLCGSFTGEKNYIKDVPNEIKIMNYIKDKDPGTFFNRYIKVRKGSFLQLMENNGFVQDDFYEMLTIFSDLSILP